MQTRLINIPSIGTAFQSVEATLSFERFAEYVKAGLDSPAVMQRALFGVLQEQLARYPEANGPIPMDAVHLYDELLQTIYVSATGIAATGEEILWAIGLPVPGKIVYGTDALYALMEEEAADAVRPALVREYMASVYALILKQCYGVDIFMNERMIHSIRHPRDGYQVHYRTTIDARFVRINYDGTLPDLRLGLLEEHIDTGDAIPFLSAQLPLQRFSFSGFSIISMTDDTAIHAIRNIKNLLLQNADVSKKTYIPQLIQSLQSIVADGAIDFGFFPFVELNGKFLLQFEDISHSILLNPDRKLEETEAILLPFIRKFALHPAPIFIKDLHGMQDRRSVLLQDFKQSDYCAVALVPLYDNGQLVGILEICSGKKDSLSQRVIARLNPVLPYLAQMLKRSVADFYAKMAQTINEKFTAIQPSVQWKFREVVRAYLWDDWQDKQAVLSPVRFEQVAPFYGSVDIRNSTLERTIARFKDLESQFDLIIPLLFELRRHSGGRLPVPLLLNMNVLLEGPWNPLSPEHEARVAHFFVMEMQPFLIGFREQYTGTSGIIAEYLAKLDPQSGLLNRHKSLLETSIQLINDTVSNSLNELSEALQDIHTCYFESYRSDGTEYDVYAGDSITPHKAFNPALMADFRRRQLESMIAIARLTHALQVDMPVPLQTTQLIFIHDERVDIGYRGQERRFDIDNAYHLRYQIIKKRLDKAQIKGTGERLTQPGKLAIVFSQSADSEPYLSLIKSLQEKGALLDAELVELEDLQGIGGLHALLVGVQLD